MSNWNTANNTLSKRFSFKNFKEALDFVNKVGVLAENMQHHPDISLHDYKYVTISSTTHDAGGITDKDKQLTEMIDRLLT